MIRVTLSVLLAVFVASASFAAAQSPGNYVVTAGTLNVRLAPNTAGKGKCKLHRGEKVEVLEVKDGWARISRYYDGGSEGLSGDVAHWVFARHLSATPAAEGLPAKPPAGENIVVSSQILEAIKSSDDLPKYRNTFAWVSAKLVDSGTCKLSDFRDIGGWWRSAAHKPGPVYYTYCGGGSNNDRIYVNAVTGEIFR